jgi:hypothetical protein
MKDFSTNVSSELSVPFVVDVLSLNMQVRSILPNLIQAFNIGLLFVEDGHDLMRRMSFAQAVSADFGLAIAANKLKMLTVEGAVDSKVLLQRS